MRRLAKSNDYPFFSIVTCTLNSEAYLPTTLASCRQQSDTDIEHIFVDGNSTDTTLDILRNYSKTASYPVVKVCSSTTGVASAFNLGIRHARGKYLLFLNSDDLLDSPSVLNDVHRFLVSHPKLDWIYGSISTIDSSGGRLGLFPRHRVFHLANEYILKVINYIPHQAVFIKRSVFTDHGYFKTNLKYCMDYEFWLRIAGKTSWRYYNQIISRYRIHSKSLTFGYDNSSMVNHEREDIQTNYSNLITRLISRAVYFLAQKR